VADARNDIHWIEGAALGLDVHTNGALAADTWQTNWLVERQIMPTQNKGTARVVVASRVQLAWQEEGKIEDQVSAFHLSAKPTAEEQ
jgi:hypothetical protein